MTGIALFAAAALLGVDVGWQPTPDGGVEYIIQIPPQAIESLRAGEAIESDVPPEVLREMRTFRIIVGNKTLPRTLPAHPAAEQKAVPTEKAPAVDQRAPEKGATPAAAPAPLPSNPASKPLTGQAAVFNEPAPAEARPAVAGSALPAAKPWLALWLTAVALFASLGANLYLGWIAVDVRRRWRTLVEKAA